MLSKCEPIESVAILVDGGFYLKRARILFGKKTPEDRAEELRSYCMRHLKRHSQGKDEKESYNHLYRIFYYDCPPMDITVFNLYTGENVNLRKTKQYDWSKRFHEELSTKRKVALRFGELQERETGYTIKSDALKALCRHEKTMDDLTEFDFRLNVVQKGVDMRIGLDIASLAYKQQVSQIVLIAGDSDFVPAAKLARREGIDFILDPMLQNIRPGLKEHIDGLFTPTSRGPLTDSTFCKNILRNEIQ